MSLKLKWASQVAESIDLLHRNGVLHCDTKPRNILLDTSLDIKIIDFSGSSLDGSKPASGEGTRFYLPRHYKEPPTVATDLFALGSTLYEIFQGTSPYEEIPSNEVERLYKQKSSLMYLMCLAGKLSNNAGYPKSIQQQMYMLPSKIPSLPWSTSTES